jgi:ABC-type nickel/cobalt efflux system permease component RcnA
MTTVPGDTFGLLLGAVALGAVHGVEPGHGWPVAASYALDRTNEWRHGFVASFVLGVGHLVSSIAMVGAFFYAKSVFGLTRIDEPLTVSGGVQIGGPVSLVAGVLLVGLGVREYRRDHSHGGDDGERSHRHGSSDHGSAERHGHGHGDVHDRRRSEDDEGVVSRVKHAVPFAGEHSHADGSSDDVAERGLVGIAWFAFLLGFAHEEEFEIIALCAGSNYCLELMSAYAITVVVGIVGLTMLLIAGYQRHRETVERYTPYLPTVSAAVLVTMGVGFVVGVL